MKRILLFLLILLPSVTRSCSRADNASLNNPETRIEYWNLLCDNTSYNGNIDEMNKSIVVRGVSNLEDITEASYKPSPQATISPNPSAVIW